MVRFYSIVRSLGPLFAFGALSGLVTGFILGTIITVIGFLAGIVVLIGGRSELWKTTVELSNAFPIYALTVLSFIICGLAVGFFCGIIFALVGGTTDYWYSFMLCVGVGLFFSPLITIPFIFIIVVAFFGAQFPQAYLLDKPLRHEREKPLREYIRNSWLARPSQTARIVGIFLPVVLYGIWKAYFGISDLM